MKNKPNLLVVGASGGVANAFLHYLSDYRSLFNQVILLDKNKRILTDRFIENRALDYVFVHEKINLPKSEKQYVNILKKYNINIVLDITDMPSIAVIEATNLAGISYVNTGLNDDKKTAPELFTEIISKKSSLKAAPHILSTGMNPGVVNMWVRYAIEKFGFPKEIINFEYDTSRPLGKWHPMITWSIHEFLLESVKDSTGVVLGKNRVKKLLPNALQHRINMKNILQPILKLNKYPEGLTVIHDENLSISAKYNIPSKFIYAIDQQTLQTLVKIYKNKGTVTKKDLKLADNTNKILDGADNIGVILDYPDKKIYYLNSVPNIAVIGTNATYLQVAIGIFAALFTLLHDDLKPGIYFVEDLYDTYYKYVMFDNIRIQEFVFKKEKKKLTLTRYNPMLRMRRNNKFEHLYIV